MSQPMKLKSTIDANAFGGPRRHRPVPPFKPGGNKVFSERNGASHPEVSPRQCPLGDIT